LDQLRKFYFTGSRFQDFVGAFFKPEDLNATNYLQHSAGAFTKVVNSGVWERFVTAMNSVGLPSKIVVAPLQNSAMQAQAETTPSRHKLLPKKDHR